MEFLDEDGEAIGVLDWTADHVRQWAAQFVDTETAAAVKANGLQLCCLLPTTGFWGGKDLPEEAVEVLKQAAGEDAAAYMVAVTNPCPVSIYYYTEFVKRWSDAHIRAWAVLVCGCSEPDADALTVTPFQLGVLAGFETGAEEGMPAMAPCVQCVADMAAAKQFRLTAHTLAGWNSGAPVRYWARHVLGLADDDVGKLQTWPDVLGLPWSAFVGADIEQLSRLQMSPHALRVLGNVLCCGLLDWPAGRL
jgi:hypothetical protein